MEWPGLEMPGNRSVLEWPYPSSFGLNAKLDVGHYKATVFIGRHAEPAASVEWDVTSAAS